MSEHTPKPELLKAATDLRDQRPWVFYKIEYADLKRIANQIADERDTLTARCEALESNLRCAQESRRIERVALEERCEALTAEIKSKDDRIFDLEQQLEQRGQRGIDWE